MDDLHATTETLNDQLRSAIASNPLEALAAITTVRTAIAELERHAVRSSLEAHSWAEIGNALGVSKQAAFQRFGKQWIVEAKAEMKSADGAMEKKVIADKLRRSLKSVK